MFQQKSQSSIKRTVGNGAELKLRRFMGLNDFSIGHFYWPKHCCSPVSDWTGPDHFFFLFSTNHRGPCWARVWNMARFSLASLPLKTLSYVPLHFFRAKFFCSPKFWKEERRRCNLLITLTQALFGVLTRGKIFRAPKCLGQNISDTLFMQKLSSHGENQT